MTPQRLFSLLLLCFLGAACAKSDDAVDSLQPTFPPAPSAPDSEPTIGSLQTSLSMSESLAGEIVYVECIYRNRAGDPISGPSTALKMSAEVPTVAYEGGYAISPTESTVYQLHCESLDGAIEDVTPATLRVLPNLPFSWNVGLADQSCFQQNLHLPVNVDVFDAYGNTILSPSIRATVIPIEGVTGDLRSGFRFTEEGSFDITLEYQGPLAADAYIPPVSRNIHVDETPPTLTLSVPARGEMLVLGGTEPIEVSVIGVVEDSLSDIIELTLNGVEQPVSTPSSTFAIETSMASRWGLSVVTGTAKDSCGNVGHLSHAFLRSGEYYPTGFSESGIPAIRNGAVAQLNQNFLDDHNREDIDDLATLAETVLANLDLNEEIPAGTILSKELYSEDCDGENGDVAYQVSRHPDPALKVTLDGPVLSRLQVVNGGIEMEMELSNIAFPLQVQATASTCVLTEITWADVTLGATTGLRSIKVRGTLGVTFWDGVPTVDLSTLDLDLDGLFVDLECGALNFACDRITESALTLFEGVIRDTVDSTVHAKVPALLAQALRGFSYEQVLQIPAPVDQALQVSIKPESIFFCGPESFLDRPAPCVASQEGGSAVLGLTTMFSPPERGATIDADALGSIANPSENFPVFTASESSFGLALRDDMLNQLFWALWYSGGLEMDIVEAFPELLPPGVLAVDLSATLPPLVMPGTDGTVLDLGMGDLNVKVQLDMAALLSDNADTPYLVDIELNVSMIMGAAIDVDPVDNHLVLLVDESPEFYFDVVAINDAPYAEEAGAVIQGFLPQVLPTLLGDALKSFTLPAIDLSGVPGLPEGTAWELRNVELAHDDGTTMLQGEIRLAP